MSKHERLKEIGKMSKEEQRNLTYEKLISIMNKLSTEERIELSNIIGYPVFLRMCMGD